jgi:hypothetical protein
VRKENEKQKKKDLKDKICLFFFYRFIKSCFILFCYIQLKKRKKKQIDVMIIKKKDDSSRKKQKDERKEEGRHYLWFIQ